ncbi:MAG: glutamine amidotransferase [bacterium]|nr:glutamine amidotransferase [bacterium]
MNKKITIGYLYPEYMNIYGDTGNIITLIYRAKKRGLDLEIQEISIDTQLKPNTIDIYFFGGGQDEQQVHVASDLQRLSQTINEDISNGAVALTICGGYQLFGKFYRPFSQKDLKGIDIFPVETHASNVRMIGDIAIELNPELADEFCNIYDSPHKVPTTLVGFENHSGQTLVNSDKQQSLGKTLYGYGNDETKQSEGCWFKNAFGTYLHGSILPKNPHFADYLLYKALEHRYQQKIKLSVLDDTLEYKAHEAVLKRFKLIK